ncbi:hypothetical protein EMCRGX_G021251 [Ephydatia muelleri]
MADNPLLRGSQYVEEILKGSDDFLEGIAAIQREDAVRTGCAQPALPMLDLHGVSRRDVHSSLLQHMQARMLEKLDSLDDKTLSKLLELSFPYIHLEDARNIVMKLLQRFPIIDEKYLLHLAEHPELYTSCPTAVKRQIWQINQGFFGEAVSPLLDKYMAEKESVMFTVYGSDKKATNFFSVSPKTRRQSAVVQELVDMIGSSLPLYNTLVQFLRTLYLRTHISHYCTLRSEIIMSLHERESNIRSADPCHKFAWCLDACVKADHVDSKKARELYTFLETTPTGEDVLGDISMLLRDPYALNVVCRSIIACLHDTQKQWKLPRESDELESLLRLLQLGLKALAILDSKDYTQDALDVGLVVKFLPELMNPMSLTFPTQGFLTLLASNPQAMHIATSYAVHLLEKRDLLTLNVLVSAIATAYANHSEGVELPDAFLHQLVYCSLYPQPIGVTELCNIIETFWVPCAPSSEPVLLHCCRLLWATHSQLKADLLEDTLEAIKPGNQLSTVAHEQYNTLVAHINHQK